MKVVNSKPETPNSKRREAAEEHLIKPSVAGQMLGVSSDALVRRIAPRGVDTLTFVDISQPGAKRRTLRLVYSECVALRDELIHNARERVNVERMVNQTHLRVVPKAVNE
jgi:hypothetical protein